MAEIKLSLVDPGGAVRLATEVKEIYFGENRWPTSTAWVFANDKGELHADGWKIKANKGTVIGKINWRPKKKELAARGFLLEDIADELIDAFAYLGLKLIIVEKK